ncbi:MAG: isopentenyl phosphate kinase, partial [Rudaea sp.]
DTASDRLVLLKLGGSAITDKTAEATPRPEVIRAAAQQVHEALTGDPNLRLVVGHGSGSFGHFAAHKFGFGQAGNWRAYAETGAAAARLNRLVTDLFLEQGVPVVSLQPSASARCRDGELVHLEVEPLRTLLDRDLVPIVYGDVALDETRGMSIASTEKIFAYLGPLLHPQRLVYLTEVGGIYSADPNGHPGAQLIRDLTPASFEQIAHGVGSSRATDVTGGMLDKVRRNLDLVRRLPGLDVYVIGPDARLIGRALLDADPDAGTHIHGG